MLDPLQPLSSLGECSLLSFWKCHLEDSETKWVRQWSNVLDPCHTNVNFFRDYYLHVFCSSYVVVKGIRIQEFFSWSGLTLALLSNPSLCMQHIKAGCDQHCIAPSRFLPLQQGVSFGPTICFPCHCFGSFLKASVASNWKQNHHNLLVFTWDAQWPTSHFVSPQLLFNPFFVLYVCKFLNWTFERTFWYRFYVILSSLCRAFCRILRAKMDNLAG